MKNPIFVAITELLELYEALDHELMNDEKSPKEVEKRKQQLLIGALHILDLMLDAEKQEGALVEFYQENKKLRDEIQKLERAKNE